MTELKLCPFCGSDLEYDPEIEAHSHADDAPVCFMSGIAVGEDMRTFWNTRAQDDELARLEREIAEASAKWVCRTDPWEPWFERERQPKAVRYLELRGLLERHPNHPDLVKVKG